MRRTEERGHRIAGSRLFRDFCAGCGEPIRVTEVALVLTNWCHECAPPPSWVDPPKRGGRQGDDADREFHGGRFQSGEW